MVTANMNMYLIHKASGKRLLLSHRRSNRPWSMLVEMDSADEWFDEIYKVPGNPDDFELYVDVDFD